MPILIPLNRRPNDKGNMQEYFYIPMEKVYSKQMKCQK